MTSIFARYISRKTKERKESGSTEGTVKGKCPISGMKKETKLKERYLFLSRSLTQTGCHENFSRSWLGRGDSRLLPWGVMLKYLTTRLFTRSVRVKQT